MTATTNGGLDPADYGVRTFAPVALLDARAGQFPNRVMMCIDNEDITFAQLRDRSNAAANVLVSLGVGQGDTVALFGGTTPEWVYFWLGAARLGALSAAINAANKGDYLRHALAITRACVVVVDSVERCQRVQQVAADLPVLSTVLSAEVGETDGRVTVVELQELSRVLPANAAQISVTGDDLGTAAYFFTSGTTGSSKAVAVSWRYLFSVAASMASAWGFTDGEVIWSSMPLFHLSAAATVLAPLLVGGTSVLASAFRPNEVWSEVRSCGAAGFVGAGAMVTMLWNLSPEPNDGELPLRFISAAPISADTYRAIEERYGCRIVTVYGLTEAFPIAVKGVLDEGVPGTSGTINPNFEVGVLDPSGARLNQGDGEIVCRALIPGVMSLGYLDPQSADVLALQPHDEWFRTGDVGRLDAHGNLTYLDRVKDSIRRRGENVSSLEVEAVVTQYPDVSEAAAVAVPSELGEDDILIVVVSSADHALDPVALLDFCADRVPYFCVPRYVRVVAELPKNIVGRVRKDILRAAGTGTDSWDREAHGYVVRR
jgi:crotonobetaine/carnitine-CoA ligase